MFGSKSQKWSIFDLKQTSIMALGLSTLYISSRGIIKQLTGAEIKVLKMPPYVVVARRIRPYSNLIIALGWFYIRCWPDCSSSANLSEADATEGSSVIPKNINILQMGALDFIQKICEITVSSMLDYVKENHNSMHEVTSNAALCMNDFVGVALVASIVRWVQKIQRSSYCNIKDRVVQGAFNFAKVYIPFVKKEWNKENEKMEADLKQSLWKGRKNVRKVLPKDGLNPGDVMVDLQKRAVIENKKWEKGFVSGAVYGGESHHVDLLNQVYSVFSLSNPLHPDIWPTVNQCEAEVISMTASLVNGGDDRVVGSITSGGTESIVLAVRAHLEYYGRNCGIEYPEILCGDTAHAGLDKACEMFGIRLVKIECGKLSEYRVDAKKIERLISSNTIMIYSSAPSFPQGVIDPIGDLSQLAIKYDVGLHVDGCLGGFVLPFAKKLGYNVPNFDFGLPGVTSMSADTHKYGYSTKGTSVLLYRHNELRRCQYFSYSKWTGGLYATPTIAGSRAGALIACAWASLVTIGESGFNSRVKLIMDTAQRIANGIKEIEGLAILGGDVPDAMVVCFAIQEGYNINIYQVAEGMTEKGWSLNSLQNPASVHLCVTLKTVEHQDRFLDDLRTCVQFLLQDTSSVKLEGSAAVYGMAGSMPAGPVNELLKLYTDITLSC
uniref:sphinganine-1-phosphate aldolase n=1 Tax=Chaetoceros debilis TaxID=122233 RepID=A0A7S3VH77_9STRA|mmetsp:Transcript_24017/g.36603  ORF Transcript_24017/g.36603 Transcript_24017/m.36603 type:complete len:665 (-) Transcript_24017:60-2054(-)|eukprot:CAMPEP_0194094416 /NCGR_PEP_ID=MMETSP0149-20130528/53958_1 /TAXON_ID=122233 /ORGANISM="Chaetoceros debilis, Strain MM31A-1" /LENGTH=664 /DNA_ID=CAMNT_0038780061 /DNA_START=127 /DNA_END=2121 /DNA_ORIENTATION=+